MTISNNAKAAIIGVALSAIAAPALAADIVIGMPNWTTVQAKAHILKQIIEDNFGLEVEIQSGANPIVFEGMDQGSIHVHPEVWMPNQQNLHDTYVNERGTVVMSPVSAQSKNGMCVLSRTAEELGITSITDLSNPDVAAAFDSNGDGMGEIFIGAPGWASTPVEQVRARDYGYGEIMELQILEDAIAYGNLDNAAASGDHWVGYCSAVHYIFQAHDVIMLEEPPFDPDSWVMVQPTDDPEWLEKSTITTGWRPADLHIHYAKSLQDSHPDVAAFLETVDIAAKQLAELSFAMGVERQDPTDYAAAWIDQNADQVAGWLVN